MRADLLEHPDEANPTLERYLAGLSALIRDVDGPLRNRACQTRATPTAAEARVGCGPRPGSDGCGRSA
jgi:hypothetical protein